MSLTIWQVVGICVLVTTTLFHAVASFLEDRRVPPPGTIVKVGRQKIHWYEQGRGVATIIVDSSLGGMDGYLLIDDLSAAGQVVVFDRPGYGWSPASWKARTSRHIATELQDLLQTAQIEPPYVLVGDSFGSYNMRLFAQQYPDQVQGLVLTEGWHEQQMLSLPMRLGVFKLFLVCGFLVTSIAAKLGIVRILGMCGLFEKIKPQLRAARASRLKQVKRSFYRANHWWTMTRELWRSDTSGRQVQAANELGSLPVINIKAGTCLRPPGSPVLWSWLTQDANRTRDQMQDALGVISEDTQQFFSLESSHFVWVDQPEIVVAAVEQMLDRIRQLADKDRTVIQVDFK